MMVEENNSYFHIKQYKRKIDEINNAYFKKGGSKPMFQEKKEILSYDQQEIENRLAEMLDDKERRIEETEFTKCLKQVQLESLPLKK